ncbi:MAG: hypothetical protein KatS3mg068_1928 [Candidatus Sericytochromatia bacterium]|nr:MAG: hypothetical protein KatS3mg068_1928 [Candidatus Sericytochromatia bacterium]
MKKVFFIFFTLFLLVNIELSFSLQNSICGNNSCESGENIDNCKNDCNLFIANNNGVCGFQENQKSSPNDCSLDCGDGNCESYEIYNCPKDCLGKGSLLTREKTNINSAVMFYYNVKHSIKDIKPYLAYIKNGKVIDYYFDTLFLIDRYFRADNIDEWLSFIDYNFVDNFNYKIKWLSKDLEKGNVALISKNNDIKSNAFYQKLYLPKGEYKISFELYSNANRNNDFVFGLILFDEKDSQIINKNIGLNYSNYLNSYFKYPNINQNLWTKQEINFYIPDNTKYTKIYFQSIKNEFDYKIDNIFLSKVDNQSKDNLICNGDFEDNINCWNNLYPRRNMNHIMHDIEKAPIKVIDEIMNEINKELNRKNKLKIVLTIPWGFTIFKDGMKEFSELYKLKEHEKRKELFKYSLKKYVDKTLEFWNKTKINNLELIGFYLDDEGASPLCTQEEWIKYLHNYLNSKNLKLFASPYNDIPYKEQIKTYLKSYYSGKNSWPENLYKHVDGLWTQPNVWPPEYKWSKIYDKNKNYSFPHRINNKKAEHILPDEKVNPDDLNSPLKNIPASNFCTYVDPKIIAENGIPLCEISKTILFAYKNNIGVEIEWVQGLENNIAYGRGYYGRVRDYMSYLIDYRFLKSSFLFFEGGNLLKCFNSKEYVYRNQYDEVYEFIKKSRE